MVGELHEEKPQPGMLRYPVSVSRNVSDTAIHRYVTDTVSGGIEEKKKFN
jgi:hypothetical protein